MHINYIIGLDPIGCSWIQEIQTGKIPTQSKQQGGFNLHLQTNKGLLSMRPGGKPSEYWVEAGQP